jgi:hypothetical protein
MQLAFHFNKLKNQNTERLQGEFGQSITIYVRKLLKKQKKKKKKEKEKPGRLIEHLFAVNVHP